MAKPSYDEVIEQRNAAREEVEALKKQIEELKASPAVSADGELAAKLGEALEETERLRALIPSLSDENAELSAKLELLRLNPIGAQLANGLPEASPSAPAIHEIPDDDPSDPRPEMHPALGWSDPKVIEWAERRRSSAPVAINEEA